MSLANIRVLKEEQQYRRLFGAGLINGIGDRFSQVAVLSLLLLLTGSGFAVGITFGIRLIPYLAFGPLGGMLADRFSKKGIMVATDIVRVWFALSPLLVRDSSDIWIIYVSSFLLSSGEALYAPARMSSIPLLVRKERLLDVNGLEQAMLGFVLIAGSVTGGVVSAMAGVRLTFILNAASFLISALLLANMKIPRQQASEVSKNPVTASFSRWETIQEFSRLWSGSSFLRAMSFVFAVWPIGSGIFNILISVYAVEVFHMGDIGIGVLYGALGVGLVAASGLAGKFSEHMKAAAIFALVMEGILNTVLSQSGYFGMAVLLLILAAVCSGIGSACNTTVLMSIVPSHLQGRFFGLLSTVQNTIMGISMFGAGFMLKEVTPRTLGFGGGILFTLAGTLFAFLFYRNKEALPSK